MRAISQRIRELLVPDQSGSVRNSNQPFFPFDFLAVRLLLALQGSLQVLLSLAWVLLPPAGEEALGARILLKADYIPDSETEVYFKAADVLILPYRQIDQSGVLFLGYSFGLPVIAADVGSLREEIIDGKTGFVFRPEDPVDLARAIETYFASDIYTDLSRRRQEIRNYVKERHSWDIVGQMTRNVYAELLGN